MSWIGDKSTFIAADGHWNGVDSGKLVDDEQKSIVSPELDDEGAQLRLVVG
ncbi:hypothetical protein [Paraburkholderia dipogonis]|uniref:hypothetical protein n=1 Tax=Paraburkholderia dipogonis TaxID=1211383 RepID=UPI00141B310D